MATKFCKVIYFLVCVCMPRKQICGCAEWQILTEQNIRTTLNHLYYASCQCLYDITGINWLYVQLVIP